MEGRGEIIPSPIPCYLCFHALSFPPTQPPKFQALSFWSVTALNIKPEALRAPAPNAIFKVLRVKVYKCLLSCPELEKEEKSKQGGRV
jgi:hypothetical protein